MSLPYNECTELLEQSVKDIICPERGILLPHWPLFTELMGGLRSNELTLLCAPTGSGKSQFLANVSSHLMSGFVPHFAAPVEIGQVEYVKRILSVFAKFDFNSNYETMPPERLKPSIDKFIDYSKKAKFLIAKYENRVSVKEMIDLMIYMNQAYRTKVMVLDNLNFFLDVVSSQMEKAEMDNAIHEFVILAKKIPIHTILVVHPRKTINGRVESEFDIKGSSTAVQEASNIILLNRPTEEQKEKYRLDNTYREMTFKKLRKRGFNVGRSVWFKYQDGQYIEVKL